MINKSLRVVYFMTLFVLCLFILTVTFHMMEGAHYGHTWARLLYLFWWGIGLITILYFFDTMYTKKDTGPQNER